LTSTLQASWSNKNPVGESLILKSIVPGNYAHIEGVNPESGDTFGISQDGVVVGCAVFATFFSSLQNIRKDWHENIRFDAKKYTLQRIFASDFLILANICF
jgi:hypothetical protein